MAKVMLTILYHPTFKLISLITKLVFLLNIHFIHPSSPFSYSISFRTFTSIFKHSSDVFFCSNSNYFYNNHLSDPNANDLIETVSISFCNSWNIEKTIHHIHEDKRNSFFHIFLHFSTVSEMLETIEKISAYYKHRNRMHREFNVFLVGSSEITELAVKNLTSLLAPLIQFNCPIYFIFTPELNNSTEVDFLNCDKCLWEIYSIDKRNFVQNLIPQEIGFDYNLVSRRPSRNNLQATVIRVVAMHSDDEVFSAAFYYDEGVLKLVSGYAVSLLKDLVDTLNFTVEAVAGHAFISAENKTIGGMGKQLLDNEVDLMISLSYILEFRVKHLSPSIAFKQNDIMVFFRQQPRKNTHRNIFIHPFRTYVWATFFTTIVLLGISVLIISQVQNFYKISEENLNTEIGEKNSQGYFWIFGAICQKSYFKTPSTASGRIVLLITFLMGWIINAYYSASIISRLTVNFGEIGSVQELISQNFHLLSDPLVSYTNLLQLSTEVQNSIDKNFVNEMDSVAKVFKGGYGFITSIDLIVIAMRNLNIPVRCLCEELSNVPMDNLKIPLAFYMRKGYRYKDLVNQKLINSMEKGLNNRYKKDYNWNTSPLCQVVLTKSLENIRFSDVNSVFVFISIAYLACMCLLVAEIVNKMFNRRRFMFSLTVPDVLF